MSATLIGNLSLISSIKDDIRDAISAKGVDMTGVPFSEYASKISEIETGGTFVTETLSVSQNGTFYPGQGVDGFSVVDVNVPQQGYTEKDITEGVDLINVSNNASYVGSYTFYNKSVLSTVYLTSCKRVYRDAFNNCYNLKSVYIPECSYLESNCFRNCSSLFDIEIPKCELVGYYAFNGCSMLTTVSLPMCSYISDYAFGNCSRLSFLYLLYSDHVCPAGGPNILWGTNNCDVYVPYQLYSSYQVAYFWNTLGERLKPKLDEIMYDNGLVLGSATSLDSGYLTELGISSADVTGLSFPYLTEVSSSTFKNCYNLSYIDMSNVSVYNDETFKGCSSLSEFTIYQNTLGNSVFADCISLENVYIENYTSVIIAGSDLFSGCVNLNNIFVVSSLYSDYLSAPGWSEYSGYFVIAPPLLAFSNGLLYGSISTITNSYKTLVGNIQSNDVLSISLTSCKSVGNGTFLSHKNLTDVYLPECESLGQSAIGECNKLSSIVIPKCKYIGQDAFRGACQNNTTGSYMTLDLPVCSYIGSSAFYWTVRSWTITLGYSGVVSIPGGSNTFNTTTIQSLYVPASLVDAYKTAVGWRYFSAKILPIPE